MHFYPNIRNILFWFDPERVHHMTLSMLNLAYKMGLLKKLYKPVDNPREIFGISITNPVGLAAGFDRHIEYVPALAQLGFGFIEVGTITKRPQAGNPRPRLFRIPQKEALINRMGFPSKGLAHALAQLKKLQFNGVLGINIGKNKDTPNDEAIAEYVTLFTALSPYASYITINISSPNTQGLRDWQQKDALFKLLQALKKAQGTLASKKYVPLVVKISPDLSPGEVQEMADVFLDQKVDGVIATNTTLSRDSIQDASLAQERGGLSGRPLGHRANEIISELGQYLRDDIPIIGCGGIMDETSAKAKLQAGAKLLQIYTGLIYAGPGLIEKLAKL